MEVQQLSLLDPIEIPLTRGYVALVDPCDVDLLDYKWTPLVHKGSKTVYVQRIASREGRKQAILLHRVIMERVLNRKLLRREEVDHVNQDALDNSRTNLRLATRSQNAANMALRTSNSTGYTGVLPYGKVWRARINLNGQQIHLGDYETPEQAGIAYNFGALEAFGEFAAFNDILDWQNKRPIRYTTCRSKPNSTGFRGVRRVAATGRYDAYITKQSKKLYLGTFDTPELAHEAYCKAVAELHGEFARTE